MDEQSWSLLNQDITKSFATLTALRINDELYAVNTIIQKIRDGLCPLGENLQRHRKTLCVENSS